jgi:DNA-binding beta-propeller fold protein YncE
MNSVIDGNSMQVRTGDLDSVRAAKNRLNVVTKSIIQLSSIVITTIVLLAACGNAVEPSANPSSSGVASADNKKIPKLYFVYGSATSEGGVKVVNADGSNETLLASGGDIVEPDGIEADLENRKIYWTDMGEGAAIENSTSLGSGRIVRADLDGTNIEVIVPRGITTTPKQLALDVGGGKVYWSDRGDVANEVVSPKIMRANLDGSGVETLVSDDLISPVGMVLDTANGKMYFTDRFANNIKRANLDGSDVEIVVKDTEYPVDLLIDFETRLIYWTTRDPGGVLRADMDGSEIDGKTLTPIVTGLSIPIGITMDRESRKLYYSEVIMSPPSGYIWESDMDGNHARKIVATIQPLGIFYTAE